VPVGHGVSHQTDYSNGGTVVFGNTGLRFVAANPQQTASGELVATRIYQSPDMLPDTGFVRQYWIINNYGQNPVFSPITEWNAEGFGPISQAESQQPERFVLWRRTENGVGATWQGPVGVALQAVAGVEGNLVFMLSNGIDSGGQLLISNLKPEPDPVMIPTEEGDISWKVFPNPAGQTGSWVIGNRESQGALTVTDNRGAIVSKTRIIGGMARLDAKNISAGNYTLHIQTEHSISRLRWIVQQ
jgi:hypothetical protein